MSTITVSGSPDYDVVVGRGLRPMIPSILGTKVQKILVIHAPIMSAEAEALRSELADRYQVLLAEVPDAEDAKRIEVAAFCWGIMGQSDFTRTDAVIGLGGGATTDLAGFVAATWLRGVPMLHIPTTVLGAVDAAVGGKTGINTSEGKNLVGAFHAPVGVLVDLELLEHLPEMEIRAGFAEIVKAGFISDTEILDIVEADPARAIDPTTPEFQELMERAITVKARVVGEDFTEQGLREILNYGHTLGHAIEHTERYKWRHGAAISIGMVFAAELSRITRGLSDAEVDRHRSIFTSLGLPTEYPGGRWPTLLSTMQRDKKARGSLLRFVLLEGIGRPVVSGVADDSLLFSAFQEIAS
ncbi:MAG: hypothetical protein RIS25_393 [Actinomycetota bacterium]|jgi:3-dehydroquinate synthase